MESTGRFLEVGLVELHLWTRPQWGVTYSFRNGSSLLLLKTRSEKGLKWDSRVPCAEKGFEGGWVAMGCVWADLK